MSQRQTIWCMLMYVCVMKICIFYCRFTCNCDALYLFTSFLLYYQNVFIPTSFLVFQVSSSVHEYLIKYYSFHCVSFSCINFVSLNLGLEYLQLVKFQETMLLITYKTRYQELSKLHHLISAFNNKLLLLNNPSLIR